jgi:hypothetical protein
VSTPRRDQKARSPQSVKYGSQDLLFASPKSKNGLFKRILEPVLS